MIWNWRIEDNRGARFSFGPAVAQNSGGLILMDGVLEELDHGLRLKDGILTSRRKLARVDDFEYRIMPRAKSTAKDIQINSSEFLYYASDITDYIRWIEQVNNRSTGVLPIFRGLPRASYRLEDTYSRYSANLRKQIPGFGVNPNEPESDQLEDFASQVVQHLLGSYRYLQSRLLNEFINYSAQPNNSMSAIEWLAYARHCGLPTPVLDFTRDPMIALYFALRASPPNIRCGEDSVVYATFVGRSYDGHPPADEIDSCASVGHGIGSTVGVIDENVPYKNRDSDPIVQFSNLEVGAILSPRSSSSAWLQKSVLLHLGETSFYEQNFALSHCFVRDSDRPKLLKQLLMIGIDETSIFESAEALAISIAQRHALSARDFDEPKKPRRSPLQ